MWTLDIKTSLAKLLMLLLFLSSMNIFSGTNIIGLSIYEQNISQENAQFLIYIDQFNIKVGEHFIYRIKGYDKEDETLLFSEDTRLFNIDSKE